MRLFSIWQAAEQAWQPVHFSRSITIPHFAMVVSPYAFSTATLAV
jgi:hypothetical protein